MSAPVFCPACATVAASGARFCVECGARLAAPAVAEGETMHDDDDDQPTLSLPPPARSATAAVLDAAELDAAEPDAAELDAAESDGAEADFGSPDEFGTAGGGAPGAVSAYMIAAPVASAIRICSYCQGTIAPDGYCLECGEREVSARDRFGERPARWIAGVSDIGLVHRRNEDALSLVLASGGGAAPTGTAVVVVCDGVTTAPDSDVASLAAAQAASAAIYHTITNGEVLAPRRGLLTAAVRAGHAAASQAVLDTASPDLPEDDAPSCTFVACAAEPGTIVTAWVGDSRAYWFPDGAEPVQVTADHSWAAELVAEGMSETEAMAAPNAHAITRWVGRDDPGQGPEVRAMHPAEAGLLLVCSDGLWNYCPEAAALADLAAELSTPGATSLEPLAVSLVDWARGQGGRDNISVALARVDSLGTTTSDSERGTDGDVQR